MTIAEVLPEPLPLVLDEAPDESLSSWLNRHAEFYGVSPSALNLRAGINTPSFARIDYWPTAGEACSIASAMRRTPEMILSMTHQPYHGRLATMIARGKPVLACPECQTIHRRDRRATVLLKSWSHGWRITCPVCSSRLQEITEGKIYPPANAFDHVWDEARNGEEMLAGIDQLPTDRAAFAVALLHLLLLPRSRTRNDVQRQIWRGKVLDVVIPGFDDVDRHAPFTVHTATPLVAPLPIRVALLAGLWRTQNNPDLYDRIESACSGRESIRFDAAKIKLLAEQALSALVKIQNADSRRRRERLKRANTGHSAAPKNSPIPSATVLWEKPRSSCRRQFTPNSRLIPALSRFPPLERCNAVRLVQAARPRPERSLAMRP